MDEGCVAWMRAETLTRRSLTRRPEALAGEVPAASSLEHKQQRAEAAWHDSSPEYVNAPWGLFPLPLPPSKRTPDSKVRRTPLARARSGSLAFGASVKKQQAPCCDGRWMGAVCVDFHSAVGGARPLPGCCRQGGVHEESARTPPHRVGEEVEPAPPSPRRGGVRSWAVGCCVTSAPLNSKTVRACSSGAHPLRRHRLCGRVHAVVRWCFGCFQAFLWLGFHARADLDST